MLKLPCYNSVETLADKNQIKQKVQKIDKRENEDTKLVLKENLILQELSHISWI